MDPNGDDLLQQSVLQGITAMDQSWIYHYGLWLKLQNLVDEDLTYRQREISEKFQWNAEGVVFMLNVDVALYIDIQVFDLDTCLSFLFYIFLHSYLNQVDPFKKFQTDAAGESSCDFSSCEAAPTATAVEAFAASNEVLFLLKVWDLLVRWSSRSSMYCYFFLYV